VDNIFFLLNTLDFSTWLRETLKEDFMGRGGALIESMPFDRRVASSNIALAATQGPWASPSLIQLSVALRRVNFDSVNCCGRSGVQRILDARK